MYLANEQVLINTAPVVKAFNESSAERNAFIEKLQYLSPAVIAQRALYKIAGSDYEQAQAFQRAASDTLDELSIMVRRAVLSKNRITMEEYEALPSFKFEVATTSTVLNKITLPLVFLLLISAVLLTQANRKNRGDQI